MDLSGASVAELTAELVQRTSGIEALDMFFTVPDWMNNTELRRGYEVIVARMLREAEHCPMNTVQLLLIERIALNYVALKHLERAPVGDDGGFESTDVLKNWNTYWLKMTAEFNNLLVKFKPDDRKAVLDQVKDTILTVINSLDDTSVRADLLGKFVRAFENLEQQV